MLLYSVEVVLLKENLKAQGTCTISKNLQTENQILPHSINPFSFGIFGMWICELLLCELEFVWLKETSKPKAV